MTIPVEPFEVSVYRQLLRIYPAAFRRRYGALMVQHFHDCYRLAGQQAGFKARVHFWLGMLTDLLHAALLERLAEMRTTRWRFWSLALILGLAIGYVDYTASEVQATLLVLLPTAFCFGWAAPRQAWKCALILGLTIPAAHLIGHALHIRPAYDDYVIASLLALIPTFLAVYSGGGLRWLVGKALKRPAGS